MWGLPPVQDSLRDSVIGAKAIKFGHFPPWVPADYITVFKYKINDVGVRIDVDTSFVRERKFFSIGVHFGGFPSSMQDTSAGSVRGLALSPPQFP